jgi:hypothetical protein
MLGVWVKSRDIPKDVERKLQQRIGELLITADEATRQPADAGRGAALATAQAHARIGGLEPRLETWKNSERHGTHPAHTHGRA